MSEPLQRRIVQLEELFSHHEHLVHQLNDSVIELRGQLEQVNAKCQEQESRIQSLVEHQEAARDPLEEKPPHY